ncbi:MAG: globin [Phenylobacterium sp.]|uniref:globin n=1 Tax=Phenylobacterium sp. TaxID=1871053 RepID=UPI0025DED498|nr:globin [Phenylobacterium sp.]MCA6247677.1 globin [Phenylobacterium sp.]
MPRNPDPREPLIVASFELAAERIEDLTPDVYARLFREQPEMEILFWRDTNHQIRGEMLTRVIQAILDFVGERHYSRTLIQSEVVVHEGYDVPPEVFRTFFRTVRDAVREVCAADWTAEWEAAWESLLADLDYYVTHPDQAETQALA